QFTGRNVPVGVHRKRANVHEAPQSARLPCSIKEISCRYDGIKERASKAFFDARSQMKDDRDVFCCPSTVLRRQQVTRHDLTICTGVLLRDCSKRHHLTRRTYKGAQVSKSR